MISADDRSRSGVTRGDGRRDQIVAFVSDFFDRNGFYPTVREVAKGVGLSSSGSTHGYLSDLVEQGRLRRVQVSTDTFVFGLPEGRPS